MPNGFLSRSLLINGFQRERYFNQLLLHLRFQITSTSKLTQVVEQIIMQVPHRG